MIGNFARGLPLLDQATAANPYHPNWFHTAYYLDYFHLGAYDKALHELENHKPVRAFWVPVAYAAVLGKLGRPDDAAPHVDELRRTKPDFALRARALLRRTIKIETVIDDVIDSLQRAGLAVGEH